tara:strand:+ start:1263 stop:1652 length:390 start_codon:yes stop_codon:yes gene_type:complete
MAQSKQWKQIERDWASELLPRPNNAKVTRVPVTGRHSGDVPDVEHPYFAVEVKYGKVVSSRTLKALEQARMASEANRGKLPIVCQSHKQEGKRNLTHIVSMDLNTFNILARAYMNSKEPPVDTGKDLTI